MAYRDSVQAAANWFQRRQFVSPRRTDTRDRREWICLRGLAVWEPNLFREARSVRANSQGKAFWEYGRLWIWAAAKWQKQLNEQDRAQQQARQAQQAQQAQQAELALSSNNRRGSGNRHSRPSSGSKWHSSNRHSRPSSGSKWHSSNRHNRPNSCGSSKSLPTGPSRTNSTHPSSASISKSFGTPTDNSASIDAKSRAGVTTE